ncbi:MAG: biotin/lipoyl-binding protein [Candidatus Omnitrophica bacterium]|nr:biotin/lipoyl-binding protein [Candidatus Omnitrophota bacterium]
MSQIILPELGEGIEKAIVAFWHCRVGDQVKKESDIVELVTDKAVFNVTSDFDGVVKEILVPEGEEAKIGQVLAIIE